MLQNFLTVQFSGIVYHQKVAKRSLYQVYICSNILLLAFYGLSCCLLRIDLIGFSAAWKIYCPICLSFQIKASFGCWLFLCVLFHSLHIVLYIWVRIKLHLMKLLLKVTPLNNLLLDWYFENLTVRLLVFYILNMHTKFRVNQMLFPIWYQTYVL